VFALVGLVTVNISFVWVLYLSYYHMTKLSLIHFIVSGVKYVVGLFHVT